MAGVYFHGEVASGDNSSGTAFTLYQNVSGVATAYTLGSGDVVVITDISASVGVDGGGDDQTGKVVADADTPGELVGELTAYGHNIGFSTGYRCGAGITPQYIASDTGESECIIIGYIELG